MSVTERPGLQVAGLFAGVLVALEAKALMTAYIRALPRLSDEPNSSHLCVHGASRQTIARFVMVNASPRLVSPDLNKRHLAGTTPVASTETQPYALNRTLQKVAEIPRRSNVRENGFDGVRVVIVANECDSSFVEI